MLPGFVATEGFPQRELAERRRTRWLVSKPERVAEAIVEAGPGGKAERYVPRAYGLAAAARILTPRLVRRVTGSGSPALSPSTDARKPDERPLGCGALRVAVVDMGTNSTRLLVAEVVDGRVREIERQSTVTRLGRGVDTSGQLAAEAIEDVCEAVAGYIEIYERLGVDRVARSPPAPCATRATATMFLAELRERFALDARILDGAEEARLTYLGACAERPPTRRPW